MVKTTEEMKLLSFKIILHAGNARSNAMESIGLAKEYRFKDARDKIIEADQEFLKAHKVQASLIQAEVNGTKNEVSIILVHAQDHLMTAITVKDLANEMIDMYEKIRQLGEK